MTTERILFFFVALAAVVLAYLFDRSKDKLVFCFSFLSVLFLPVSLLLMPDSGSELFLHAMPQVGYYEYGIFLLIVLSYPIGILFSRLRVSTPSRDYLDCYSMSRLSLAVFILSFIALLCFFTNFSRVNFSLAMLFVSPRHYEEVFGRYWILNYGYFLSVPASMLIVVRWYLVKSLGFFYSFLLVMLFSISLFHGIKYTVFDAIIFPMATYFVLFGFDLKKRIIAAFFAVIFILFFSLFSYFVRGSETYNLFAFLNYIIPNYYNFLYALNEHDFLAAWPMDAFVGFFSMALPLDRNLSTNEFVLNDKYNMLTGFQHMIASLGYLGVAFWYGFTAILFRYAYSRGGLIFIYLAVYILFCYLMMFYSYYLGLKYKYVYFFLVFVLLDFFVQRPRNKVVVLPLSMTLR